jgi:hypothetical protein
LMLPTDTLRPSASPIVCSSCGRKRLRRGGVTPRIGSLADRRSPRRRCGLSRPIRKGSAFELNHLSREHLPFQLEAAGRRVTAQSTSLASAHLRATCLRPCSTAARVGDVPPDRKSLRRHRHRRHLICRSIGSAWALSGEEIYIAALLLVALCQAKSSGPCARTSPRWGRR